MCAKFLHVAECLALKFKIVRVAAYFDVYLVSIFIFSLTQIISFYRSVSINFLYFCIHYNVIFFFFQFAHTYTYETVPIPPINNTLNKINIRILIASFTKVCVYVCMCGIVFFAQLIYLINRLVSWQVYDLAATESDKNLTHIFKYHIRYERIEHVFVLNGNVLYYLGSTTI